MTREEHLAWCKERALEYLNQGDLTNAVASMSSDIAKHEETALVMRAMGPLGMLYVINHDELGARRWIEGFR